MKEIGYEKYSEYGIDLKFQLLAELKKSSENINWPIIDFWLFDESIVALMNYSHEGEFTGITIIEDNLTQYIELKSYFIKNGFGLEELSNGFPELK